MDTPTPAQDMVTPAEDMVDMMDMVMTIVISAIHLMMILSSAHDMERCVVVCKVHTLYVESLLLFVQYVKGPVGDPGPVGATVSFL